MLFIMLSICEDLYVWREEGKDEGEEYEKVGFIFYVYLFPFISTIMPLRQFFISKEWVIL